ncbi:MAG: hypothetical protein AAF682_28265 [Planctomycetota bacterium]
MKPAPRTRACLAVALALPVTLAFVRPPGNDDDYIGEAATIGNLTFRLDVERGTAFVATLYGLETFDITDPTAPQAGGAVAIGSTVYDVEAIGDYCYVADTAAGVLVYDISDTLDPQYLGTVTAGGNDASGLFADDDYLFVFRLGDGMKILDRAADPVDPPQLGSFSDSVYHNDGMRVGDLLYVADGVNGPTVFDVSDPAAPQPLSEGGQASFAVDVLGSTLFTAAPTYGLESYDVSPPLPAAIAPLDDWESNALGFSLNLDVEALTNKHGDDFVLLADQELGCVAFDANDPADLGDPIETFGESIGANAIHYHRGLLLVASASNGLVRIYVP